MTRLLGRSKPIDLSAALEAVKTLARLGEGRLDDGDVVAARDLAERADERLALGSGFTVAALAGATGSGKSSLFNALVGSPVSSVGVRRPTTSDTTAAVWGSEAADDMLEWLGVERRHRVESDGSDGLVLLDLPDHDSTQAAHRDEVDRLVELVDVFLWVVDPQKYADAALHDLYLRPLARHAPVTLVLLNQADRLEPADRDRCLADLRRLLGDDGLSKVTVIATSATTGAGLEEVWSALKQRAEEKKAAVQRLSLDLQNMGRRFERYCGPEGPKEIGCAERQALAKALAEAAGAETIAEAARRSYRRDAGLATGWAVTRWVRRFRPDPLARLHLGRDKSGRTSARPVGDLERARVDNALRRVATETGAGLPEPWPTVMREAAAASGSELLPDLDRALGRADVQPSRPPRWWRLGALLQAVFLFAAVAGFVWLGVLFGLEWFRLPDPPTPEINGVPWPTLLFFGGLLVGFLFAALFGVFARVGASRAAARARTSVAREVGIVADERVVRPLEAELDRYSRVWRAIAEAKRS